MGTMDSSAVDMWRHCGRKPLRWRIRVADPEVDAIVAAIGGNHSCHLLPLLDFDLIARNPRVFCGFSDITVLNVAIQQRTGLVTFNGPMFLSDFSENSRMLEYTERHFLRAVASGKPIGELAPSPDWTEEWLDWETAADSERPRVMEHSPGWSWLRDGAAEGALMGGCLESLEHLRGTTYWPDWRGAIFFFETSEEAPPPQAVDAILMDYENMGILSQIAGLIVGRPMRYTPEQRRQLREVLLERTARYHFPIVADVDFGHTSPQFTLPLGIPARLDAAHQSFEILEPATR
jgi:muramoyltetrapeptide carboxypeptidase LdcA involved in peptidoglycan recycling